MKKLGIGLLISLLIDGLGTFLNYRHFLHTKNLLLSLKVHGGEVTLEFGFGMIATHVYAMLMNGREADSVRFNVICFLVFLFAILLLVLLLLTLYEIIRRKDI